MRIERIDHIHIVVKDLPKAASFYENLLGMKFSKDIPVPEHKVISRVGSIGGIAFELMQPTSPDCAVAKFIEHRGEGVQAISLKVSNVDEAAAEAKSKGFRVVARVELPLVREAELHPKDLHGVQIELCQYEMGHPGMFAALEKTVW